MKKAEMAETIQEMMRQYDNHRAKWIAEFGSADGFDEWFTTQVLPEAGIAA